tara:strand:+ start:652 stop:801 length:150 start_codon:yes stop_codon:yes gene_type:complete
MESKVVGDKKAEGFPTTMKRLRTRVSRVFRRPVFRKKETFMRRWKMFFD